jgi:hypothetical protein
MSNRFQHLFRTSATEILSLNDQARLGSPQPERTQFANLVRHFLERFFNNEMTSPDGDAKAHLILIAFVTGLPGFVIAIYLWTVYHSFIPHYLHNHHVIWTPGPPPYWEQVNHHFFYVVYSFVALGIATIYEWDLFFPDLLDIFAISTLPIPDRRLLFARIAAISLLIAGFLLDANILAIVVLPVSLDPPNLLRFLAGHVLAVTSGGLFATTSIIALQGTLLFVFGEFLFRKVSLILQGSLLVALLLSLFLFPVYSSVIPILLHSGSYVILCFPPFWFLGIYQRLMEGPSALAIYSQLAYIGYIATFSTIALAAIIYPLAYRRRVQQLVEGISSRPKRNVLLWPIRRLLHASAVRTPIRRAVFHFITQTLLRVPRYRIYLVLYGGVGLSVIIASILRFSIVRNQVHVMTSSEGMRASIGIVAFWAIAGLRITFLSPGNQQGRWVFHFVQGNPALFPTELERLKAARIWVFLFVSVLTGMVCLVDLAIASTELLTWHALTAQVLVGTGMCLLLTQLFFLDVTTLAFTGDQTSESPSLAITIAKCLTFLPIVVWLSIVTVPWIEQSVWHYIAVPVGVAGALCLIELRHRAIVREHCMLFDPDNRENLFLLQLDLRQYDACEPDAGISPTQAKAGLLHQ